ncbi:hypothetical protein ROA7450_01433 [Roseovarius albus]|uniref:VWFA domain-containing protein n=1 Tax=Roseovarius albus TaxID=1247867 RepID=A0A1X6YUV1_9RHOB|nr:DUF1194 domain-containing protein [Roseovarius albus]SLN31856.1 hypothetical protein ROA7450_01433 [Roseovarius albus]
MFRRCLAFLCYGLGFASGSAYAACNSSPYVSTELVLAVDTSISISTAEYQLQMRGIADALRSPQIIKLIEDQPGGVAMGLVHWSVGGLNKLAVDWHRLCDLASVARFAQRVEVAERSGTARGTSISAALRFSAKQIEENQFYGDLRKIDISGDSRSNSGPSPVFARNEIAASGVTINGLVIKDGDPELDAYYLTNVVGGKDSFVLSITRHGDFAEAMQRKLERELTIELSSIE